jgi:hypothetical protein
VPLQVTAGGVIAIAAIPYCGTSLQASTEATVNSPQLAVLLLPPQFAVADTLYVLAAGLAQTGAFAQVIPVATVLTPHLTVGCVIAVPANPVAGIPVQVSWSAEGAAPTVNVPLHLADLSLHSPELTNTNMSLYVPIAGLLQFGALTQSKPLLTTVPLQVTVGGIIAMLAMPVEGTAVQVSAYVTEPDSLFELPPKSLPLPSSLSDEQEMVNAIASTRTAESVSLKSCVIIVSSFFGVGGLFCAIPP